MFVFLFHFCVLMVCVHCPDEERSKDVEIYLFHFSVLILLCIVQEKVQRCWCLSVCLFGLFISTLRVHCPGQERSKDVDVWLSGCLFELCWCYLCIVQVKKGPKMLMFVCVYVWIVYVDVTCALSRWGKVQRCWCLLMLHFIVFILPAHCPGEEKSRDVDVHRHCLVFINPYVCVCACVCVCVLCVCVCVCVCLCVCSLQNQASKPKWAMGWPHLGIFLSSLIHMCVFVCVSLPFTEPGRKPQVSNGSDPQRRAPGPPAPGGVASSRGAAPNRPAPRLPGTQAPPIPTTSPPSRKMGTSSFHYFACFLYVCGKCELSG